jgi:hypothetical protein
MAAADAGRPETTDRQGPVSELKLLQVTLTCNAYEFVLFGIPAGLSQGLRASAFSSAPRRWPAHPLQH